MKEATAVLSGVADRSGAFDRRQSFGASITKDRSWS